MPFAGLDDNAHAVSLALGRNGKAVNAHIVRAAFSQFCPGSGVKNYHLPLLDLVASVKAAFGHNLIALSPGKDIYPVGKSTGGCSQYKGCKHNWRNGQ